MLIHSYNEKNKRYIKNKILDKNIFNSVKEEIVIEGSSERLRPIILTVVTTVVGIFPLIFSSPI
jgi:Cu/Ag efflux pump CusA